MPTFSLDLLVDQYADFVEQYAFTDATGAPIDFTAAADAKLMGRVSPTDASPTLSISTTPNSQGAIYLGPTVDAFGTAVPAGSMAIWIAKSQAATQPVLMGHDLLLDWLTGETDDLASGRILTKPGNTH